ncbi:Hypp7456 [Branchiostoma lanceolatum]|uniref:Hypp7456 protein n=1 Tax=Branchiostoma lanceolatum TaxID=7740 RepID=A0A8K0EAK4_BRALA|nr:Hypp7456 [Branchiostoma lanceolatum]
MPRIGTGVLIGVLLQLATGGGQELSPAFVRARCASKCLSLHDVHGIPPCVGKIPLQVGHRGSYRGSRALSLPQAVATSPGRPVVVSSAVP